MVLSLSSVLQVHSWLEPERPKQANDAKMCPCPKWESPKASFCQQECQIRGKDQRGVIKIIWDEYPGISQRKPWTFQNVSMRRRAETTEGEEAGHRGGGIWHSRKLSLPCSFSERPHAVDCLRHKSTFGLSSSFPRDAAADSLLPRVPSLPLFSFFFSSPSGLKPSFPSSAGR